MLVDGHFLGGPCDQATGKQVVRSPWDGRVVGTAAEGGWSEMNGALDAATEALTNWRASSSETRQAILRRVAALVRERREELAQLLIDEIGKPFRWAEGEVNRLAITFDLASAELDNWGYQTESLDYDARGRDYDAGWQRDPVGVVLAIVPYNWPFNLTAHKVAPALAAGNTVVLKPSAQASLCTLTLVRLMHEAGVPPGVVNAVHVPGPVAEKAALDPRVQMVSFTGSPAVGWKLKVLLPRKKVSLELGGNAFAIVDETADLDWAVERIVAGKFGYAGQICISVQNVLAHQPIYEQFREKLAVQASRCTFGDPALSETVCGPLISIDAAKRVEQVVHEALNMGARELVPFERENTLVKPTVLENVPTAAAAFCEEIFGPVLTLGSYGETSDALSALNNGKYGIHVGYFSNDEAKINQMIRDAQVGGVVINDYPTLRFDGLPYGGVKESGSGREGVRFAMEEMSELKSLVRRRSGQG